MNLKDDYKMMIDVNTFLLWVKGWWISLTGAFSTIVSAWFSGTIILFIDPNTAGDLAKIIGSAITIAIGSTTLWYTIKERKKKTELLELEIKARMDKIIEDKEKDTEIHIIEIVRKLEESKLIDSSLSIEEKIKIAQNYLQHT